MNAIAVNTIPMIATRKDLRIVEQFLSAAQVAKRFRVTARTVVRWIDEGRLPGAFQVNPDAKNSPFLIPVVSVEAFAKDRVEELDTNGKVKT